MKCDICNGTGYLLHQSYEQYIELPEGAITIQRCDECQFCPDDELATMLAMVDHQSTCWGYALPAWPNEDYPDQGLGDYWFIPGNVLTA